MRPRRVGRRDCGSTHVVLPAALQPRRADTTHGDRHGVAALPAYLSATGGVTGGGDPIGSLCYTLVCFIVAGLCLAAAVGATARQQAP